jgi:hypothetical protein
VYLDSERGHQAIFIKHDLNPMGTPLREEVALNTPAARAAVAKIMRDARAPQDSGERAVLAAMLATLESAP